MTHFVGMHEDEILGKAYDRQLLARFLGYLRPYRGMALCSLLLLPLIAATKLAQPYILKIAIDNHIVTGQMEGLPTLSVYFFGPFWPTRALPCNTWVKVMFDLRMEVFPRPKLSTPSRPNADRRLVTRVTSDVKFWERCSPPVSSPLSATCWYW
jgi:ATP-binding cassette subfamily B protein